MALRHGKLARSEMEWFGGLWIEGKEEYVRNLLRFHLDLVMIVEMGEGKV